MIRVETKGKDVLIVDDEMDICYLLSGMLKQRDLSPDFVNSLSDAQKFLSKNTPTLLFLDNRLPDGLGLDFIPYVKKHYPSVKVIMITAHDSSMDRKMAYEGGADYFMGKPLTRLMINDALDQFV